MSVMTSLARVLAADSKAPQRITVYRHLHISHHPIVMVPITLAGETNAPLAIMVGTDRDRPQVIVTRQPRERAERLRFAERLAGELLLPIQSMAAMTERVDRGQELAIRAAQAPQIWVPNPGGIEYIRLLGRMTRFRVGLTGVRPEVLGGGRSGGRLGRRPGSCRSHPSRPGPAPPRAGSYPPCRRAWARAWAMARCWWAGSARQSSRSARARARWPWPCRWAPAPG